MQSRFIFTETGSLTGLLSVHFGRDSFVMLDELRTNKLSPLPITYISHNLIYWYHLSYLCFDIYRRPLRV